MTPRALLIGALASGTVLAGVIIGALAIGIEHPKATVAATAAVGSCAAYAGLPADEGDTAGMAFVPGGSFTMGSERHQPEERFTHVVRVDGFWIDRHEVTNAQFQKFVDATSYRTLAERGLDPQAHPAMPKELVAPGSVVFVQPTDVRRGGRITQWWQYVAGANWRSPTGPGSTIAGKHNHPVVHIAYEDALAYARWLGRELPTEAQWEFAARGGRDGEDDYSSAFDRDGKPIANTWQGIFPVVNSTDDGYAGTAPVGCFPPNGYGLYDMIGNVWEWTRRLVPRRSHARGRGQPHRARSCVAARRARPGGKPRDQGRLISVCPQLLRPLPASGTPRPGDGSRRRAYRVQDGAQQAEFRNVTVVPKACIAKERAMIVTLRVATIVLGFAAASFIGISTAAASEGSA